jgi:hypothetical protein
MPLIESGESDDQELRIVGKYYSDVVLLLWWTAFSTYRAIVALHHE